MDNSPTQQNSFPQGASSDTVSASFPPVNTTSTENPASAAVPVVDTTTTAPAPLVPPVVATNPIETTTPPPAMPPPPPPVSIQNNPVISTPTPKGGSGKKFLLIIMALLIFVGLGFAIWKFVIPRFTGGTSGSAEITWWSLWEDEAVVLPLIEEYQQTHPNVKINYVSQAKEDYRERLLNALARGEGPDIFRFHNSWVPMFRNELSALPSDVMSAQEFAQTFYPVAVSDLTLGSGIVGIPLSYDGLALYVNEEIFSTYAKSPPKTWDELRQTAIDLTIRDESDVIQQSGVALGKASNVDHWQEILALMMIQNGVSLSKPTGQLAEDAMKFFTSFSTTYDVWDESMAPSTTAFASGKLAMYIAPSWRMFEIMEQNPNLKFRVYPVPQLPKDNESDPDITYATYWVEGVWERSKSKEAAWDFLKFLSTQESLEKMYEITSETRRFGELYPRVDMRELLLSDPLVGGFVALAPGARSWYLASRTFDGSTGINSQIGKYFEDAVNSLAVNTGFSDFTSAMQTVSAGVTQVLVQYGLIAPPPTPSK